jgi:rSAM/selenodomain-associated transferase 2
MISVIIPAFNEEGVIGKTLDYINTNSTNGLVIEVIVVDGGSIDNTVNEARAHGAIVIESKRKGRAAQMNTGALAAQGAILYFLHADSVPPGSFATDIRQASEAGFDIGCFRLQFDLDHWFLKANAWFTRFDINAFRFGDQSLFVDREVFVRAGKFCENHIVMEDQEIIGRLRQFGKFIVVPKPVITSSRKYEANGIYKMQAIFFLIYFLYKIGYSQQRLVEIFRNLVQLGKI